MEALIYIYIVAVIYSTYNAFGQGLDLFYQSSGTVRTVITIASLCFCNADKQ